MPSVICLLHTGLTRLMIQPECVCVCVCLLSVLGCEDVVFGSFLSVKSSFLVEVTVVFRPGFG